MSLKRPLSTGLRVSGWGILALAGIGVLKGLRIAAYEPNSGIVVLCQWVIMAAPAVYLLLKDRAMTRAQAAAEISEAANGTQPVEEREGWMRDQFSRLSVESKVLFVLLGLAAFGVIGYALLVDYIHDPGSVPRGAGDVIMWGFFVLIGPPLALFSITYQALQRFFFASPHIVSSGAVLFGLVYYIYFFLPLALWLFTRHTRKQGRWLLFAQTLLVFLHALLVPLAASHIRM